ncbi:hypothetical protein AUC69_04385 [Methyloceanibacter superfactus]|uniref:GmrSD restriction endonucleases N-terminal domain-containing protein n=1 Tax=Methyloceanibacter superfactus TaxID=1774969 RepID=A0A1E3VIV7_9HYPH|nr:DUF262 domain-containing protein [Methyloceanibacter superfactus]ODR93444.1 hypothetical protein AUC69_04385 [Methyloceanibacter superfactus]
MALDEEIKAARKEIVSDGYEMSIGELMNLYRDDELRIDPEFQRLFRWDDTRKTRFIESLLLGIPIPPIFVFQDDKGIWELIDGLQRLSTIFQFTNILKGPRAAELGALSLEGTNFLPSLAGKRWEPSADDAEDGIGEVHQLEIKRARLRVEILKKESDPQAKFELFQRLNTGGAALTEQEVRNCVAVMLNKDFHEWLVKASQLPAFVTTTIQTEPAIQAQAGVELVLRFLAFRHVPYTKGLDVHEYLDQALPKLATEPPFDANVEERVFEQTFSVLSDALGSSAFKRWDGESFGGKFLMSVFEVMAIGTSKNIDEITALNPEERSQFLTQKAKALWDDPVFQRNSGAGVRGTTRLVNLLPMATDFLRPH